MLTSLLDWREVIIRPMARGHLSLGQSSPMGFKRQKQNPPNPPNKTLLFLVCLARKPHGNPLQALVSPIGRSNYSANPPEPKSHLFPAQVHPPNHLRMFRLLIPPLPAGSLSSMIRPLDPILFPPPVQSPSHSHDEACQEFTDLKLTLMTA
ncbi:hypothetical protein O181_066361 [Austropuccinia psidii MF-1]|uniref:Uncharacterized protein n=1 Tax=Austropuccinia psidii MF-1 TaxID=1389203 RepID=A0A9Q3I251_9BASI|nr:hypothetical protein [Austropuccinia psidii MF-1]